LHRWLRGEPILARPISAPVRVWMWCKRKPALASLSATLMAALLVGVITITYQWRVAVELKKQADRARDAAVASGQAATKARDEAIVSQKAAVAARAEAEQNALIAGQQATSALGTLQALIVAVQKDLNVPRLYAFRKKLLDLALARVNIVANIYDKSTSREATALAANLELAKIYRELGEGEKAHKGFEKCLAIARERVKIKEGSDSSRQNLANVCLELAGSGQAYRRDMNASMELNNEAVKIWEDIVNNPKPAGFPIDPIVKGFWQAEAHQRLGICHYRLGDLEKARDEYQKAYDLRLALIKRFPNVAAFPQDLSYSEMALAETAFRLGDPIQAEKRYDEVLRQREVAAAAKGGGDTVSRRKELAAVHYMIGEFKMETGDLKSSANHLDECLKIRQTITADDPESAILKRGLAIAFHRRGNLADLQKNAKDATEAYQKALGLRKGLANEPEADDSAQVELAITMPHGGDVTEAAALADRIASAPKIDREYRFDLARCYAQCGRATREKKDANTAANQAQAEVYWLKAIEQLRKAVAEGYRDRVSLETEPDLAPIRNRDDFKALLPK
jgi:tetratricopeptide (TPR) repeat protein